jgi:hypothetical protein
MSGKFGKFGSVLVFTSVNSVPRNSEPNKEPKFSVSVNLVWFSVNSVRYSVLGISCPGRAAVEGELRRRQPRAGATPARSMGRRHLPPGWRAPSSPTVGGRGPHRERGLRRL